jgi:hypothetical protein
VTYAAPAPVSSEGGRRAPWLLVLVSAATTAGFVIATKVWSGGSLWWPATAAFIGVLCSVVLWRDRLRAPRIVEAIAHLAPSVALANAITRPYEYDASWWRLGTKLAMSVIVLVSLHARFLGRYAADGARDEEVRAAARDAAKDPLTIGV